MHKPFWMAVAVVMVGAPVYFSANAIAADSPAAAAQKAIQAILDKQNAASKRLDGAGVWAGHADDFYVDDHGERRDAEQCKAETIELFRGAQSANGASHIDKITLHSNIATVVVTDSTYIVLIGADKQKTVLAGRCRVSEVWAKRHGQWLETHETTITLLPPVDGRARKQ